MVSDDAADGEVTAQMTIPEFLRGPNITVSA